MDYFETKRKSFTEIGKIYFWTATIHNWNHLLKQTNRKEIIISSMEYLSSKGLVDIFGFVIMPNHIHLMWRMNKHEFKKVLKPAELNSYFVNACNKKYEFWQRDSLATELYSSEIAYQKLDYIHNNPLAKDWKLSNETINYKFSSANFYQSGDSSYKFLNHIGEEFLIEVREDTNLGKG